MSFVGGSSFATDFEQVIDRAVAIAALPLVQMENYRASLADRQEALAGIDERFSDLQAAIAAMDSALSTELRAATVGDETMARVTLSGNVLDADYALQVTSLGSRTLTLGLDSLPPVSDPFSESISASTDFTLTVDGIDYTVTPSGGSLFDLASAINAAGAGVQATIVNIGNSSASDYRLSIQSEKYAALTIQLNDGTQDLLQTLATGSNVVYQVNGVPVGGISTDTRTVTLSPGVTADLLKTGATEISVAKTTANLIDTLAGFVTAYNAAVSKLDLHRGVNNGALSGQAIVSSAARSLSVLSGYAASGGNLRTLAEIGLSLDNQGNLSFDQDTFKTRPINDIVAFLGGAASGGFLAAVTNVMSGLQDSSNGMISLEKASLDRLIQRQDELIASNDERIGAMRQNLMARMAAADAVIAVLEQQARGIQALFEAMSASRESLR